VALNVSQLKQVKQLHRQRDVYNINPEKTPGRNCDKGVSSFPLGSGSTGNALLLV
jgi:hypothetical protein